MKTPDQTPHAWNDVKASGNECKKSENYES